VTTPRAPRGPDRNPDSKSAEPGAAAQTSTDKIGFLGGHFASKLAESLGQLRASIVIIASMGMYAVQGAHSSINVLGIISIVIVAIGAAVFAPRLGSVRRITSR
jgi:hypothetical protein